MNNAAMSGTHYPLDKEPRGRNDDDDEKVKISSTTVYAKLRIIKAFLSSRITKGFQS